MRSKKAFIIMTLAACFWAVGCSDDGHDEHQHDGGAHDGAHLHNDSGGDVDKGGCTHMKSGPFVDVTGASDAKSAPEVKADHKAYRVTIPVGSHGWVRFKATAKGDHLFYLDADVLLAVQDDQGKALTAEKTEKGVAACTIVKAKVTFDLPAAGTYYIKLGPSAAHAKATLVIEASGHAH